jgi:hypothetical protein
MCRHFANSGHCVVGDACVFAHGEAELKKVGDSYGQNFGNSRGGGARRGGRYNSNMAGSYQSGRGGYSSPQVYTDYNQTATPTGALNVQFGAQPV